MKTIRLKTYPYFYVKPVNRSGQIFLERAEEPFKIPDSMNIETLSAIWNHRTLSDSYEISPLHQ